MARNGVSVACAVRSHRLAEDPDWFDDHVGVCLRCQAEAVRFRTVRRNLSALRVELVHAPPGLGSSFAEGWIRPARRKAPGFEAAVATAGLAAFAGAIAIWRRTMSA